MGRLFWLPKEGGLRVYCMYTKNKGVVAATPPRTEHIARATYLNKGAANPDNRSNIDYFLIREDAAAEEIFGKETKAILETEPKSEIVQRTYGVYWKIAGSFRYLEPVIKQIGVIDIRDHMHGKPKPKLKCEPRTEYADSISSETGIIKKRGLLLDAEGKQSFYPECILDINLDFARWCMSNVHPNGKLMPWGTCKYCYAGYKHTGYPYVFAADKDEIAKAILEARAQRAKQGLPTRFLRFGKKTEAGADIFHEQIVAALEACVETGINAVFPTKYLKFNREIADLLRKTDSTLLPSFGNDRFEQGACAHGRTNDWRFEQGVLFQEAGVRVVPYVLVDAVKEDGGKFFRDNLRKAEQLFPKVQILPIRLRYEKVAKRILEGWTEILEQHTEDFFGEYVGGYERSKDNTRLAVYIHPSLSRRVQENNGNCRMCHHNSKTTWCGKCFVPEEKGRIIETQEVFVERKVKRPHRKKKDFHPQFDFKV